MNKPFRYYLRVRYAECDAQKVVFNSRYGDYVELATTEFMRALEYEEELRSGALDYQLVRQTLEWKSPARFDDIVEVRVMTLQVGTTSFTIVSEMFRADTEQLLATSETVYVLLAPDTLLKTPVPQDVRAALLKGAPGRYTDHAGFLHTQGKN